MMRKYLLGLVGAVVLSVPVSARALMIAPAPIPQRVATADAVVTGKVIAIEEKSVEATSPYAGAKDKVEYQIAVVKLEQSLSGVKGLTHVKVGIMVPKPAPVLTDPNTGTTRPIISSGGRGMTAKLAKDQEVLLFLKQHPTQGFYTMPNYFDVVEKNAPNFKEELAQAQKFAKYVAEPTAGLKSKDEDDRLGTAYMLLTKYRQNTTGSTKQAPIAEEESKLILQAIAESDWTKPSTTLRFVNGASLFNMLGVTVQDGFTPPKDFKQREATAKKWLADNLNTYRIKQFVVEKTEKK